MPTKVRTRTSGPPEDGGDGNEEIVLSQDLVDRMLELEQEFKRGEEIQSAALWGEGDLIAYKYPLNDEQLGRLAKRVHLTKSTLAIRRQVAQIFPEGKRNPALPWSVHAALARLNEDEGDSEARQNILFEERERPWTVDEVRFEVKKYLDGKKADEDDTASRQEFRGGMSVGGIKVAGRLRGQRLEIVVYTDPVSEPSVDVLEGDSVTMIFKVQPE